MLRRSENVRVNTYPLPSTKTFTVNMNSEHQILGIVNIAGVPCFLVEESNGSTSKDFAFRGVTLNEQFDKPMDWSFLGETQVVIDPDADRPASETRYVYGLRSARSMGGALSM